MVKKSRRNENNKYNDLKIRQIELPFRGIGEFLHFNFCRTNKLNQDINLLSPHNLCKKIEFKLEQICIKKNWHSANQIISELKLPNDYRFKFSPLNFKYVYEYALEHKTQEYFEHFEVSEEKIVRPVDDSFQLFYS